MIKIERNLIRLIFCFSVFWGGIFAFENKLWGEEAVRDKFIGKAESIYAAAGPHDTAARNMPGFKIYYPVGTDGKHPIIAWGNGTRSCNFSYLDLFYHFASWGFVVIAPHSTLSGSGKEILDGVDDLIERNRTPGSILFRRIDPAKIGLAGHALGGSAAINAASDPRINCVAALSPAPAKVNKVKCPMFLIAGDGNNDFSPEMVRLTAFSNSKAATVFGTIKTEFESDGGSARGYLTAWFRYFLKNDSQAGKVFLGDCEICGNPNWQVEMKRSKLTN